MREMGVYVVPQKRAVRVALCGVSEAEIPRLVEALSPLGDQASASKNLTKLVVARSRIFAPELDELLREATVEQEIGQEIGLVLRDGARASEPPHHAPREARHRDAILADEARRERANVLRGADEHRAHRA